MANHISDETIEYVGILAKLELSGEEKEQAKKDMESVLDVDVQIPMKRLTYQEDRKKVRDLFYCKRGQREVGRALLEKMQLL